MLTPEKRAFKWYASLLPSCRHTLVSQNLSSDPRTHINRCRDNEHFSVVTKMRRADIPNRSAEFQCSILSSFMT